MIPKKIEIEGFLSYRDSVEIIFEENEKIWIFSGKNGSGKSTIFDAMTFALYKKHRGGGGEARELINVSCNKAKVTFEFLIGSDHFQIERALQLSPRTNKIKTTQQASHNRGSFADPVWERIEGTQYSKELEKWIEETIGLSYEAFTSSVLLLQGNAERLIQAPPAERAKVLAEIVDLKRYESLHELANERKKSAQIELDANRASLETESVSVSEEDYQNALSQKTQTEVELEQSQKLRKELELLAQNAKEWERLQAEKIGIATKRTNLEKILNQKESIEKKLLRFKELQEVTPIFKSILEMERKLAEEIQTLKAKEKIVIETKSTQANIQNKLDTQLKKKTTIEDTVLQLDQKISSLNAQYKGELEKKTLAERLIKLEQDLKESQQKLQKYPNNLSEQVNILKNQIETLAKNERIILQLQRTQEKLSEYKLLIEKRAAMIHEKEEILIAGKELRSLLDQGTEKLNKLNIDKEKLNEEFRKIEWELKQIEENLKNLNSLQGKLICELCGQALTTDHLNQELERYSNLKQTKEKEKLVKHDQWKQKEEECSNQTKENNETAKEKDQKMGSFKNIEKSIKEKDSEILTTGNTISLCLKGVAELGISLPPWKEQALDVLLDSCQTNLNNYIETNREANQTKNRLSQLEQQLPVYNQLEGKIQSHQNDLSDTKNQLLKLIPNEIDPKKILAEFNQFEQKLNTAHEESKKIKLERDRYTQEIEKLNKNNEALNKKLLEEEKSCQTSRIHIELNQKSIQEAKGRLSTSWLQSWEQANPEKRNQWQREYENLVQENIDQQKENLQKALGEERVLSQQETELTLALKNIPAAAQKHYRFFEAEIGNNEAQINRLRELQTQLKVTIKKIEDDKKRILELNEKIKKSNKEVVDWSLLSELLGRKRLQRYLMVHAENQILDFANQVLDRISEGKLRLRQSGNDQGESGDRALDLVAYQEEVGGRALNISFLSGSQKFRVAVSLALGVGRFASKQYRPIESVIIDEGFGSLDTEGRQTMVQELQALSQEMKCIILVSHQEDFAESFSNGFYFQLQNQTSVVTPFP